jgi:hypothetical protein
LAYSANPSYFCAALAGVSARTGLAREFSVRVAASTAVMTAEARGWGRSSPSLPSNGFSLIEREPLLPRVCDTRLQVNADDMQLSEKKMLPMRHAALAVIIPCFVIVALWWLFVE